MRVYASGLTLPSSGHATACHAWPSFHSGPCASCRCVPLMSNVRARRMQGEPMHSTALSSKVSVAAFSERRSVGIAVGQRLASSAKFSCSGVPDCSLPCAERSISSLGRFAATVRRATIAQLNRRAAVLRIPSPEAVARRRPCPNPSVERTPSSWPLPAVVHLASSGQLPVAAHLKR